MSRGGPTDRGLKIESFRNRFRAGRVLDFRGDVVPPQKRSNGEQRRRQRQRLTKEHKDAEKAALAAIKLHTDAMRSGQFTAEALKELHAQALSLSILESAALKALRDFQRAQT